MLHFLEKKELANTGMFLKFDLVSHAELLPDHGATTRTTARCYCESEIDQNENRYNDPWDFLMLVTLLIHLQ